ncbi:MAG: type IV secretion protein [Rhodanobacter sp.]|jgi:intracellular multiplication protein IcmP
MAPKGNSGERTFNWSDPPIVVGMIAIIIAITWLAWHFGHTQIAMVYVYVRYVELWPLWALGRVTGWPGLASVDAWIQRECRPDGLFSLCHRNFATVPYSVLADSSLIVNGVLFVVLLWQVGKAIRHLLRLHPSNRFSRKHTIKSFVDENKALYPHLRMFSALDLISQPLDHPVFGMSQTSRQFAFENGLIMGWQAEADGTFTPTLDREKTALLMRRQLGRLWTRSTDLSIPEAIVLAIALPRVAATDATMDEAQYRAAMGDCDAMIKWAWSQFVPPVGGAKKSKKDQESADPYAWLRPDIDPAEPRRIIQKWIGHPANAAIIQKHAYVQTVLFRLMLETQRLGVLPPAEMRWMRFYNRPLWYVLENYGRSTGFAEGVAVMGHYLYEIKQGEAIVDPQLDKVVNGIESAMTAFRYDRKDVERYEARQMAKTAGEETTEVKAVSTPAAIVA